MGNTVNNQQFNTPTMGGNTVTAEASKKNAKMFYYGNIIAALMPFPFFIFWFGASMFVYAMYRHHPNKRVGFHIQRAAYYYYALAGLMLPLTLFAPADFFFQYWWLLWVVLVVAMIPISMLEILKINKESWVDVEYDSQ